jgi:hypothetical protein
LDLGKALAVDFIRQALPAHYGKVAGFFNRRGAYRRYKELLERQRKLEEWYAFEASATKQALREWVTENQLPIAFTENGA